MDDLNNTSPAAMISESRAKMNAFENNGAEKWDTYMGICQAYLDCGLPNFIQQQFDLRSFPSFVKAALQNFGRAWPLKPHSDVVDSIFTSNKMRTMATFQGLYVGLEPYKNFEKGMIGGGVLDTTAPAVFGLLSAIELHLTNDKAGVYAPVGGFGAVTQAMQKLALSYDNVCIQCNATVLQVNNNAVLATTSAL